MQLEGNFPDPDAIGAASSDVGAGLASARFAPRNREDSVDAGPAPARSVPVVAAPAAPPEPNLATLHSSSLSLPAALPVSRRASIEAGPASAQVVSYPNNAGEGLDPARFSASPSGEDSSLLFLSDAEE